MQTDLAMYRKLIADGGGNGEDRRFTLIYKQLLKILNAKDPPSEEMVSRFIKQLEIAEQSMAKQTLVYDMNVEQIESYKKLSTEIEEQVKRAHEQIGEAKKELQLAKQIRKNRQEYDLMAKMIEQHPSRHQTEQKLLEVKQELKELADRQKSLESKVTQERNHLYPVYRLLANIAESYKEESKNESKAEVEAVAEDAFLEDDDEMDQN